MSIKDFVKKIKEMWWREQFWDSPIADDLFFGFIVILVAVGAFGLGRISKIEGARVPIRIEGEQEINKSINQENKELKQGLGSTHLILDGENKNLFVASKTGKKYFYPWCSGAQRISELKRIYFASKEQASVAGYTAASGCKGL